MKVIKADISYIKIAAGLFDSYRVFYGKKPDISGAEEFLRERILNKESMIFLVFEGGEVVGFM